MRPARALVNNLDNLASEGLGQPDPTTTGCVDGAHRKRLVLGDSPHRTHFWSEFPNTKVRKIQKYRLIEYKNTKIMKTNMKIRKYEKYKTSNMFKYKKIRKIRKYRNIHKYENTNTIGKHYAHNTNVLKLRKFYGLLLCFFVFSVCPYVRKLIFVFLYLKIMVKMPAMWGLPNMKLVAGGRCGICSTFHPTEERTFLSNRPCTARRCFCLSPLKIMNPEAGLLLPTARRFPARGAPWLSRLSRL